MELKEKYWKIKLNGEVVKRYHKMVNDANENNWHHSVKALNDLLDEILKYDPEFKDVYTDLKEEIVFLDSPDSFEYDEDENLTPYQQWENAFNDIVSTMYDYCDANDIWIEPIFFEESLDLNEALGLKEDIQDGWEQVVELDDYEYVKKDLEDLFYEVDNARRGVYTRKRTYAELGQYIKKLAEDLDYLGDTVLSLEEE